MWNRTCDLNPTHERPALEPKEVNQGREAGALRVDVGLDILVRVRQGPTSVVEGACGFPEVGLQRMVSRSCAARSAGKGENARQLFACHLFLDLPGDAAPLAAVVLGDNGLRMRVR